MKGYLIQRKSFLIFTKFTEQHLQLNLYLIKRLHYSCISVNLAKF